MVIWITIHRLAFQNSGSSVFVLAPKDFFHYTLIGIYMIGDHILDLSITKNSISCVISKTKTASLSTSPSSTKGNRSSAQIRLGSVILWL